jgi:hypothetical protein
MCLRCSADGGRRQQGNGQRLFYGIYLVFSLLRAIIVISGLLERLRWRWLALAILSAVFPN